MEDPEGALSFDFEGGLDATANNTINSNTNAFASSAAANNNTSASSDHHEPPYAAPAGITGGFDTSDGGGMGGNPHHNQQQQRRSFRQTVCRHWLRSLCMKGDSCGFLHQYDKARMPVCRFFRLYGECREQDCVYKHTNDDVKECNMYKLGFCPNGPECRYRHAKLPGPPPPIEEVFQKVQQITSFSGPSNRFYQHRNNNYIPQADKNHLQQISASSVPGSTSKPSPASDSPGGQHQQSQVQYLQQQQPGLNQLQANSGPPIQVNKSASSPLPIGQTRYFIVKSCNKENLDLSVQKGIWATQRSNEAKLNEAFDSSENVILIFSINRTRNFQGCARMMSKTGGFVGGGGWKYAHGTAHYGRNFSVKWLKLCELSFHKTRHLRNPYNENLPVKISRDCQELEPSIGEQLASLLYLEPDSELMAVAVAAEAKKEEEKSKGIGQLEGAENPDIVPFEDNEEEEEDEEEEESDEEEIPGQAFNLMQNRGRGRGMMWPPHMPLGHGGRGMPAMKHMAFPPVMMAGNSFGYGAVPTDGFPRPDVYGMGPRGFGPYPGPRFPGDFSAIGQAPGMNFPHMDVSGPPHGMAFPGRPQAGGMFQPGGMGMMMGPVRGPFMGGFGMAPRGNRPAGMQFRPPPSASASSVAVSSNGRIQRDIRRPSSERASLVADGGKAREMPSSFNNVDADPKHHSTSKPQYTTDAPGSTNSGFKNDESESEDEAPRRSRHGESKKKR